MRRADEGVDVDISVRCSSGTYIRAIARDLGAELGVGGHLDRACDARPSARSASTRPAPSSSWPRSFDDDADRGGRAGELPQP